VELGWAPWVFVFDNMKTVTSGRDAEGQPLWTAGLLQLTGEFGVHPQACDPRAGNQKGSVEALVKWVKGNFLAGRVFADDADLAAQAAAWREQANTRPSAATGVPPCKRLPEEAAAGEALPATARDYGLCLAGQVSAESLVAVLGNRYSVPVAHVRAPVIARVHRDRVRLWRDTTLLADHARAADGARQRVVDESALRPALRAQAPGTGHALPGGPARPGRAGPGFPLCPLPPPPRPAARRTARGVCALRAVRGGRAARGHGAGR